MLVKELRNGGHQRFKRGDMVLVVLLHENLCSDRGFEDGRLFTEFLRELGWVQNLNILRILIEPPKLALSQVKG